MIYKRPNSPKKQNNHLVTMAAANNNSPLLLEEDSSSSEDEENKNTIVAADVDSCIEKKKKKMMPSTSTTHSMMVISLFCCFFFFLSFWLTIIILPRMQQNSIRDGHSAPLSRTSSSKFRATTSSFKYKEVGQVTFFDGDDEKQRRCWISTSHHDDLEDIKVLGCGNDGYTFQATMKCTTTSSSSSSSDVTSHDVVIKANTNPLNGGGGRLGAAGSYKIVESTPNLHKMMEPYQTLVGQTNNGTRKYILQKHFTVPFGFVRIPLNVINEGIILQTKTTKSETCHTVLAVTSPKSSSTAENNDQVLITVSIMDEVKGMTLYDYILQEQKQPSSSSIVVDTTTNQEINQQQRQRILLRDVFHQLTCIYQHMFHTKFIHQDIILNHFMYSEEEQEEEGRISSRTGVGGRGGTLSLIDYTKYEIPLDQGSNLNKNMIAANNNSQQQQHIRIVQLQRLQLLQLISVMASICSTTTTTTTRTTSTKDKRRSSNNNNIRILQRLNLVTPRGVTGGGGNPIHDILTNQYPLWIDTLEQCSSSLSNHSGDDKTSMSQLSMLSKLLLSDDDAITTVANTNNKLSTTTNTLRGHVSKQLFLKEDSARNDESATAITTTTLRGYDLLRQWINGGGGTEGNDEYNHSYKGTCFVS